MRKPKIKRGMKVKSAHRFIGIIQEVVCYVPQIRVWHEDRFIKTSSLCIMRHPKVKCLNRIWGRI